MKKIIAFLLLFVSLFAFSAPTVRSSETNGKSASVEIKVTANVVSNPFLIVESSDVDFGDIEKGGTKEAGTDIRVFGRKDNTVTIFLEKETVLSSTDGTGRLTAKVDNHNTITGKDHRLNEKIDGDDAEVTVPLRYTLSAPGGTAKGAYVGTNMITVVYSDEQTSGSLR